MDLDMGSSLGQYTVTQGGYAAGKRQRKSKGKSQKAKISEPGPRPGWAGIFAARKQNHRQ
jgi:hypothetical protein